LKYDNNNKTFVTIVIIVWQFDVFKRSVQYKCSQLASTFIFHILQCTFQRLKDTNRYCALAIIKFLYDKVKITFLFSVTITIIDVLAEVYIIQVYII